MRLGKPGDVCICVGMAVADEGQNRNFGVQWLWKNQESHTKLFTYIIKIGE
jgi:hypothetical protein